MQQNVVVVQPETGDKVGGRCGDEPPEVRGCEGGGGRVGLRGAGRRVGSENRAREGAVGMSQQRYGVADGEAGEGEIETKGAGAGRLL